MNVYQENDYKEIIRRKVKDVAKVRKGLTLQKIAARIGIQNSYLSKTLNDEKTHLNEDHLFQICQVLDFFPQEIDYLFLLRARSIASNNDRRAFVESKINRLRQASQRNANFQDFDIRQLNQEISYFFDPLGVLVQAALFIPQYRENPRKLGSQFGIEFTHLKQILQKLDDLGFIKLAEDRITIKEVRFQQLHYGTDHPLMRTHQHLLRSKCATQLVQTVEEDKNCFMGTFTADPQAFTKIKFHFQTFMKEVEKIVADAPSEKLYQLNFDLFRWL